jgi:hypothetical protein
MILKVLLNLVYVYLGLIVLGLDGCKLVALALEDAEKTLALLLNVKALKLCN